MYPPLVMAMQLRLRPGCQTTSLGGSADNDPRTSMMKEERGAGDNAVHVCQEGTLRKPTVEAVGESHRTDFPVAGTA